MQPLLAGAPDGSAGFAVFETPAGTCGIAWRKPGIRAIQLPEGSRSATRARLFARGVGDERPPPPPVRQVVDRITALLGGEATDLGGTRLDWTGVSGFQRRVYEATRCIPFGETATYGDVAQWIGMPTAARAVGRALGCNPFPLVVPCHRVVGASGIGGFSATGGADLKRRLLEIETGRRRGPASPPR